MEVFRFTVLMLAKRKLLGINMRMIRPEVDYIAHCIDVIDSIDAHQLGQLERGALVGQSQSGLTRVFALGRLKELDKLPDLALKVTPSPEIRVDKELTDICIVTQKTPELISKFPYFIGLIAVKDAKPFGIITEDATRGGRFFPRQIATRQSTLDALDSAFKDMGGLHVFDEDELEETSTFEVDGEERILDLSPSIMGPYSYLDETCRHYMDVLLRAHRAQAEVTLVVDESSPLAQSIPDSYRYGLDPTRQFG